jgi:xanthine/uracil permease
MSILKLREKICLTLGIIAAFFSLSLIYPCLGDNLTQLKDEFFSYSFMLAASISLIVISLLNKVDSKITILSLGLVLMSILYPYLSKLKDININNVFKQEYFILLSSIIIFIVYIVSFYKENLRLISAVLVISLGLLMFVNEGFFAVQTVAYLLFFTAISLTKFKFKEGE